MAAPSGIKWGSVVGDYGKIGIYTNVSTTNTTASVTVEIWFASKYSASDTNNTLYYDAGSTSISSATTDRGSVSISTTSDSGSGWSDANEVKLKTYTYDYDRGTSEIKRYLAAKLTNVDIVEGTMSVTSSFAVPALTSYTISYNANGGSGAPSPDTKYYGKNLKLSSTKPTRTGYTFVGWGTSASDTTADYSAGGSYTANASDTLYAIWQKTITLSYDANGGSGAPSPQSATIYNATTNKSFTISNTKPTRTGYTFLGWSTSSTATSSSYSAGGSITLSDSDTLYAVWSENALTVNYYSNYADYATFKGTAISVSASTNILVHSDNFYYDNAYSSGLSNIQNVEYVYMSRAGYTPTGYWGTTITGGTLINQSTTYNTGQALAQALGKNLSSGNASINLYPQWKANTYTIAFNANGGTGSINSQSVDWNEYFIIPTSTFKREGYKFIGYNVKRSSDNKWYVAGQKWQSDSDIKSNGYTKKLYLEGEDNHIMGSSWTDGTTETDTFTFYAVWEISGVVYIDNGDSFEPYLAYIDNGTGWDLYLMYVDDGADWNIIS